MSPKHVTASSPRSTGWKWGGLLAAQLSEEENEPSVSAERQTPGPERSFKSCMGPKSRACQWGGPEAGHEMCCGPWAPGQVSRERAQPTRQGLKQKRLNLDSVLAPPEPQPAG